MHFVKKHVKRYWDKLSGYLDLADNAGKEVDNG